MRVDDDDIVGGCDGSDDAMARCYGRLTDDETLGEVISEWCRAN